MADWWELDTEEQAEIAALVNETVDRVIARIDRHANENTMTGGGFIVSVRRGNGAIVKACLYQAKLLKLHGNARSLKLQKHEEAERLLEQVLKMRQVTPESVGLFYTRRGAFVVPAKRLGEQTTGDLRTPLAKPRLISLGTYLGKWVARCTRGDANPRLVETVRYGGGFQHIIEMNVHSDADRR